MQHVDDVLRRDIASRATAGVRAAAEAGEGRVNDADTQGKDGVQVGEGGPVSVVEVDGKVADIDKFLDEK